MMYSPGVGEGGWIESYQNPDGGYGVGLLNVGYLNHMSLITL